MLTIGAVSIVVGTVMVGWAWTRPVGRDPSTTTVGSVPARTDYPDLIALIAAGVGLAVFGVVTVVVGLAVLLLRRRSS